MHSENRETKWQMKWDGTNTMLIFSFEGEFELN